MHAAVAVSAALWRCTVAAPAVVLASAPGSDRPTSHARCWDGFGRPVDRSLAPPGTFCTALVHGWTRCTRPVATTRGEANVGQEFWCKTSGYAGVPPVRAEHRRVCWDASGRLSDPRALLVNAQCRKGKDDWTQCTSTTGTRVDCHDFATHPFTRTMPGQGSTAPAFRGAAAAPMAKTLL